MTVGTGRRRSRHRYRHKYVPSVPGRTDVPQMAPSGTDVDGDICMQTDGTGSAGGVGLGTSRAHIEVVVDDPMESGNGTDSLVVVEDDPVPEPSDDDGEVEVFEEGDFGGLCDIHPLVLWALLQTSGARKMTVDQYGSIRSMVNTLADGNVGNPALLRSLPHYRTLTKSIRPIIMDRLAVPARDLKYTINVRKAGAHACRMRNTVETARVSFVSPVDIAVADFANPIFFKRLVGLFSSKWMGPPSRRVSQKSGIQLN